MMIDKNDPNVHEIGGADTAQTQPVDTRQLRQTVRDLIAKLQRTNNAKEAKYLSAQLLEAVLKLPK